MYKNQYAKEMTEYFSFADGEDTAAGIPSFVKFAARIGERYETLLGWRERYPAFRAAYDECRMRLRDYLIDGVLTRRFDASFVKTLLAEDLRADLKEEDGEPYRITLTVIGEPPSSGDGA